MPFIIPVVTGLLFYILSILVHVLVIKQKISYTLVNGGRSTSYEAQAKTSVASIAVLALGIVILLLVYFNPQITLTLFGVILMGLLTLYWTLGFVMQLLGTRFEKRVMSIVLLLGIFSHLMIMLEYFQ